MSVSDPNPVLPSHLATVRFLLIDNDALVLFAGSGLLGPLLSSLGIDASECRKIASFDFVFRKKVPRDSLTWLSNGSSLPPPRFLSLT